MNLYIPGSVVPDDAVAAVNENALPPSYDTLPPPSYEQVFFSIEIEPNEQVAIPFAQNNNLSTFEGIFSKPVVCYCGIIGRILLCAIAGFVFIGVFYILPMTMISYGAENKAVVCESPCVGNCSNSQRSHDLHTPSIGISVPQALIVSGVLVIVVATNFVITMSLKYFYSWQPYKHYKLVYASEFLLLFIWSCICIVIVSKMNMQCKNYNDATGDASVVSMEPDLLLGTSVSMLILSFAGFCYYIYYSRV